MLITDEAIAWVGYESDLDSAILTKEDVLRYLVSTGDRNPIYTDDRVANAAGYGSRIVPHLLHMSASRPASSYREVSEDGTVDRRPSVGQGRAVAGEVDIEFFGYFREGDCVEGRRKLASLEEKFGDHGAFVVATWATDYFNAAGDKIIAEIYRQILT